MLKGKKLLRITTVPISLATLLRGQMKYMSQHAGMTVWTASANGEEVSRVKQQDEVSHFVLPLTRTISPLKDIKALWATIRLIRKLRPDIVHTHTPKAGIVGMMAAWMCRTPVRMHTVAGLPLMEATGKRRKVLDWVEKLTYSFATKVYPNSFGLYDIILSNKYTGKDKLRVIGNGSSNGIDTSFFDPQLYTDEQKEVLRSQLGISKTDFVFIFVGRLVKDKGLNELIEAFVALKHNQIKLLLVGNFERELDPLTPTTEATISGHPGIIEAGFQKDVRPYFSISNCLAFPSYREGFPNVIMQAGAMGLPCIVSDINGCNEIIKEGENGMIIPVKDAEALRLAMELLLENAEEWAKRNQIFRHMITSRYEQKVVWEAIAGEYAAMLKTDV